MTSAEVVINFTEPPRSNASRGGRHVEFGIALAKGAWVIVVGYRENIFHWLPQVDFCRTWEEVLALPVKAGPFVIVRLELAIQNPKSKIKLWDFNSDTMKMELLD